jgi:subtilisin family serine protease
MAVVRVIVELKPSVALATLAFAPESDEDTAAALPSVAGVELDPTFPPVPLPRLVPREMRSDDPHDTGVLLEVDLAPEAATYVARAEVEEEQIEELRRNRAVLEVYSDPRIEPTLICPGDPAQGTHTDVERLLCTSQMRAAGMAGSGVLVAIVDTGVNIAYLNSHGKSPTFDPARSWAPQAGLTPGSMPVDHGTMCAFDVCIAAPNCTLLDIALLSSTASGPTIMSGFLSDAIRAYRHLIDVMTAPRRPGEARSLVVNNSWGMFHPSWDFPVGDPGNYSDNPDHPFNRIVGELELVGADILFAAGNCGANCPDGRCQGVTANAIYGANGHPQVLCIAGVDTTKQRVGYSTIGPGRLTRNKPDLSGYTHFRGSGVYPADGGTSAATPVVTGVVAAVRSRRPYNPSDSTSHPAAIRTLMTSTAEDVGTTGYDLEHGYGIVNGCRLAVRIPPVIDICRRYPWLCEPKVPIDICRRYPQLCRRPPRLPLPPFPPIPPFPPGPPPPFRHGLDVEAQTQSPSAGDPFAEAADMAAAIGITEEPGDFDPIETSYVLGWIHAQMTLGEEPDTQSAVKRGGRAGGCGCGEK